MEILSLPLSKNLDIVKSENEGYLLQIETLPKHFNHIKTTHGAVIFALAETSSGYYLSQLFSEMLDRVFPILRSSKIKYIKPIKGSIFSKASILKQSKNEILEKLKNKKKCIIEVEVFIFDKENHLICKSIFNWLAIEKNPT